MQVLDDEWDSEHSGSFYDSLARCQQTVRQRGANRFIPSIDPTSPTSVSGTAVGCQDVIYLVVFSRARSGPRRSLKSL